MGEQQFWQTDSNEDLLEGLGIWWTGYSPSNFLLVFSLKAYKFCEACHSYEFKPLLILHLGPLNYNKWPGRLLDHFQYVFYCVTTLSMNRSHIKITNNFLLVFPPNKTQNLSEIRVSQNLVNLRGGGIELEKIVQLVRGGGGGGKTGSNIGGILLVGGNLNTVLCR